MSAVVAKCYSAGTSRGKNEDTKQQLHEDLKTLVEKKSYLVLIDDVWSANMLENIINALPVNEDSRIIVTTRFHSVATTRREGDIRRVTGLDDKQSQTLFEQAFAESKGSKDVTIVWSEFSATTAKTEDGDGSVHSPSRQGSNSVNEGSKYATVPNEVWRMCGRLPLAIVTMAGHCNVLPLQGRARLHLAAF